MGSRFPRQPHRRKNLPRTRKAAGGRRSRAARGGGCAYLSLIVGLVIAVLTAWIAPAIARQRDDWQKARELRVAIAGEIALKGTRVIRGDETATPGYKPAADYAALFEHWLEESTVISAKLRAYFPSKVVSGWADLQQRLMRLIRLADELPAAQKRHAAKTRAEVMHARCTPS